MSAFAVFCATDGSLTFYNRDTVPAAGDTFEGKVASNVYTGFDTADYIPASKVPWHNERANIISVSFMPEFATVKPISTRYWFDSMTNMISFNKDNFNTSKVRYMGSMFKSCFALTSLDVSNFDTSSVSNMYGMFNGCSSLTSLDLSNFNTSKVTSMSYMFNGCSSLTSLDLSNFNTSKVTSMSYMFYNCSSLTSLDLSNFDTSSVTNMTYMFNGDSALTSLDLSSFDTSNVTNMSYMFRNCTKLTTIYASQLWSTEVITSSSYMFTSCSKLVGAISYNSSVVDATHANYETGYLTYKCYKSYFRNRYVVNGSDIYILAETARAVDNSESGITFTNIVKALSNIRNAKEVLF